MVNKKKKVLIIIGCIVFLFILIALWIISSGFLVHNAWNDGYEAGYIDNSYYSVQNCIGRTTDGELEVTKEEGELNQYVAWVFCVNLFNNEDFQASNNSLLEYYQIFLDNAN